MTRMLMHGWKRDDYDPRDRLYSAIAPTAAPVPPRVDLRDQFPAAYDQGQLGSCTANAIAGHMQFLKAGNLSRLEIYYDERVMEGTVSQDAGAMIRDGIKSMNQTGAAPETDWPYDIAKFTHKPPAKAVTDAAKHRISSYHRIIGLSQMKACLAEGFPFVIGFDVFAEFESEAVAKTGVVPMPKKGEASIGGHAVIVVGYDDATQMFLVRNSWGPDWGDHGFFTIPYAYLSSTKLADDAWTIRK